MENIFEIVFMNVVAHLLADKSLQDMDFGSEDYQKIRNIFLSDEQQQIKEQVLIAVKLFIKKYFSSSAQPDAFRTDLLL